MKVNKILATLLAVVMIIGMLPTMALATDPEASFHPTNGEGGWSNGTFADALTCSYDLDALGEYEPISIQLNQNITLSENMSFQYCSGKELTYSVSSDVWEWVEDGNGSTGTLVPVTIDPGEYTITIPVGVSVWLENVNHVEGKDHNIELFSAPAGYTVIKATYGECYYIESNDAATPAWTHIWDENKVEATKEFLDSNPYQITAHLWLDGDEEEFFFPMTSPLDPGETIGDALDALWVAIYSVYGEYYEDITVQVTDVLTSAPPQATVTEGTKNTQMQIRAFDSILSGDTVYGTVTPIPKWIFAAQNTSENVGDSPYADWYCDYVVSMDDDTDAYSIGLYGNYGDYGDIAFLSPVDASAGAKIPLLRSMANNPWKYQEIVGFVGTFECGAFNLSPENVGKTLTVQLVLWNPNYGNDGYIDHAVVVEEIEYTFTDYIPIYKDETGYIYKSTGYAENGFILNENGEEIEQTVAGKHFEPIAYVAQIGETPYATLAKAVGAITTSGTINLLDDFTLSEYVTIPAEKTVTLDYKGYTITSTLNGAYAPIENYGTLTVIDTSTGKTGGIAGVNRCINNYGTLNVGTGDFDESTKTTSNKVFGGNYSTSDHSGGACIFNKNVSPVPTANLYDCVANGAAYVVNSYGSLNVYGGEYHGDSCNGCESGMYAYSMSVKGGTANIYDATVTGVHGALAITGGIGYIYGGSYSAVACERLVNNHGNESATYGTHYALYVAGEKGNVSAEVYGGNFSSEGYSVVLNGNSGDGGLKQNASLKIFGGTFEAKSSHTTVFNNDKVLGDPLISGGTFKAQNAAKIEAFKSSVTNKQYLGEGCELKKLDELSYEVVETTTYVAKIGTTKYETFEAAFAAAQDGNTITVLADCSGNGIIVPQGKFNDFGLTVDFGGYTYTVDQDPLAGSTGTKSQAFQLLKENKITFQNGTIYSEKARMLVQNYSDLTLDNMTLTLNNQSYTSAAYTLSNNNGSATIKDTTINANNANSYAFDVCRYSSYPSVHVTVQGDSVINGDVEVYASKSDPKNGFSLTLESGTMTGDIVLDQTAKNVIADTPEKATVTKAVAFTKDAPDGYKWNTEGKLVAIEYVAQIGTTKYETLAAAIAAANATGNCTITLLKDYNMEANEPGYGYTTSFLVQGESKARNNMLVFSANNITFDLGGHTLSNLFNNTFSVTGSNVTIQNGEMRVGELYYSNLNGTDVYTSVNDRTCSYIVYVTGAQNFVVDNLTTYGGINVSGGSTATINDLSFSGTKFYAVCSQTNSTVTLNGGTYNKAITGATGNLFWIKAGSTMNITGGNYKKGDISFINGVNPVITGGYFDFNPTNYGVATGFTVINNPDSNSDTYKYKVVVDDTAFTNTVSTANDVTVQKVTEDNVNYTTTTQTFAFATTDTAAEDVTYAIKIETQVTDSNNEPVSEGSGTTYQPVQTAVINAGALDEALATNINTENAGSNDDAIAAAKTATQNAVTKELSTTITAQKTTGNPGEETTAPISILGTQAAGNAFAKAAKTVDDNEQIKKAEIEMRSTLTAYTLKNKDEGVTATSVTVDVKPYAVLKDATGTKLSEQMLSNTDLTAENITISFKQAVPFEVGALVNVYHEGDPAGTNLVVDEDHEVTITTGSFSSFEIKLISEESENNSDDVNYVAGYTLTLEGQIGVNFYMKLTNEVINANDSKIVFTFRNRSDKTKTVYVSGAQVTMNSQQYYKFTYPVAPAECDEDITLTLYSGDSIIPIYVGSNNSYVTSDNGSYSRTLNYVTRLAITNGQQSGASADDKKLLPLAQKLLSYCVYSKAFFASNNTLSVADNSDVTMTIDEITTAQNTLNNVTRSVGTMPDGVSYVGTSLVLNSGTDIKMYFSGDMPSFSYKKQEDSKSISLTPVQEGIRYYVKIPNIVAAHLDDMYEVYCGDIRVNTYSALAWARSAINSGVTERINLGAAMYYYNNAANTYFGNDA